MPLSDFLLDASRVLVGLGLSVWIGGTVLMAASSSAADIASSPEGGNDGVVSAISHTLDRLKFIVAGCILVGLLLEVQVLGSSLPPCHVVRAGVLFLLIASHVYAVMVVQPKMRYYREKFSTLEEEKRENDPWRTKFHRARRRSEIVSLTGLLFAVVSLVLG